MNCTTWEGYKGRKIPKCDVWVINSILAESLYASPELMVSYNFDSYLPGDRMLNNDLSYGLMAKKFQITPAEVVFCKIAE